MVVLKFLRAEEFDVEKAYPRITSTLVWRCQCCVETLRDAELPEQFQGHDFFSGTDVDGRPVMINRFGNMDLPAVFGDCEQFVRYRVKCMEQAISRLTFRKGAAEDLCQIHDYSGVSLKQEPYVKGAVKVVTKVFGEHYPEFKGKTIFVNFPRVFAASFKAFVTVIPARTLRKFMILGHNDHWALFQLVHPDSMPVALGGVYREGCRNWKTKSQVVWVRQLWGQTIEGAVVDKPKTIH